MDDLFVLPKPSEEFTRLREKIDEELLDGAMYSAPTSGNYRQSVQLRDLDGDGISEAIAFFSKDGEEHPLRICIYRENDHGEYETMSVIEGGGTNINSVYYADMNGDSWDELIIGWKQTTDVMLLSVYVLRDFVPTCVAVSDYTDYAVSDFDGDRHDDAAIVRFDRTTLSGSVDLLRMGKDGEVIVDSAALSPGGEGIQRLIIGATSDGKPGLFAEGLHGGGLITDVYAFSGNGNWQAVSQTETSGISSFTMRDNTLSNCRDINEDGVTEIPVPRTMLSNSDVVYKALDWYSISSSGEVSLVVSTFHNTSDGWYLALPAEWRGKVAVRRQDGTGSRVIIFSYHNSEAGSIEDFLAIYAFTGENRVSMASYSGRFTLKLSDGIVYAAEFFPANNAWDLRVDRDYIVNNFKLIYQDWYIGGGI
jgi:hypothetical protein